MRTIERSIAARPRRSQTTTSVINVSAGATGAVMQKPPKKNSGAVIHNVGLAKASMRSTVPSTEVIAMNETLPLSRPR